MKNVILVPKDKSPLDVLAEMGKRTTDAWIFLNVNTIKKLRENCDVYELISSFMCFSWNATGESPRAYLRIGGFSACWFSVIYLNAGTIEFKSRCADPEEIIFLKMAE